LFFKWCVCRDPAPVTAGMAGGVRTGGRVVVGGEGDSWKASAPVPPPPSDLTAPPAGDAARSASPPRVAHAGKGKSTASGEPGSRAGEMNMVPGLAIVARCRLPLPAGKPYSGRAASAASRRPTTRTEELAMMRRSTSLAVCCAPIRMIPSDRPAFRDVEQDVPLIGLAPIAGGRTCSIRRSS